MEPSSAYRASCRFGEAVAYLCMGIALVVVFLTVLARPAQAQQEPLLVPFAAFPPFMQLTESGERTGFIVELSEMIGAEIDVPIEYLDVANSREFVAAQSSGQAQMIAGVLQLPPLKATNVFSDIVAIDTLRPAVLAERLAELGNAPLEGRRIGIVPPAQGSEEPVLDQNSPIAFDSPQAAVMALLSGGVDAVLMPPPVVYGLARDAGVDDRIVFLGTEFQNATRHVALHESRADLLAPINAAIAAMEADGRLEALRTRFDISVPPPPPDVLTVGITDLPPLSLLDEDGDHSGFIVEVTRALAERANLQVRFVPLLLSDWVKGPGAADVDMIAALVLTPERREVMDFSLPVLERKIAVVVDRDDALPYRVLSDLAGRRVGVISGSVFEARALAAGLRTTGHARNDDLLMAKQRGEVDAILIPVRIAEEALDRTGTENDFRIVELQGESIDTAIALRRGLGPVRERLNSVIPGFILSGDYAALRAKYFVEPVFWTRARIIWSLAAVIGLAAFSLVALMVHSLGVRARAAAALATVKDELETIFQATSSGIIAFDADGLVVRVNNQARHFLGGVSTPVPFPWPANIKFLDAEDLHPLDASANPVSRAIAGAELQNSVHLMSREQSGENHRYVRLDSKALKKSDTDVRTVLVLEDVSAEERNRQVVERKGRLEALGQLTGGIAHDFNNHLATLLTSIFLAGRAKDGEKREKHLKIAEDSVIRARSLTTRLMAFAKRQPGLAESANVKELLGNFENLVSPMIEESIRFEIEVEDPELLIFCELAQLESALLNLVLNSRDAILRSGKGNRITLSSRAVPSPHEKGGELAPSATAFRFVEISVTDNGPGMSEENLSRAIDPFFTTKDSNSGTGLGLSMVYGFARQSEGDLRLYSEEGLGTTVQLTLPRGTVHGFREAPVAADEIVPGAGQTVLLAEDEPEILEATAAMLQEFGYKVLSAPNGQEALNIVQSGATVDLLLTDVVMPGALGGFNLAEKVHELKPGLPVVYFSGYTGFSAAEMGSVAGTLLQKPAAPAEMSRAISAALSKKG